MNKKKVFNIFFIITIANLMGKFLGFFKDVLVSNYYGTSGLTDAYFMASSIPYLILGVFTSSTDSAIMPLYNRIRRDVDRKRADKEFLNIVNVILIISFFVSLIMLINPRIFIQVFAPGFEGKLIDDTVKFLRIFSFCGLFHILYCFYCTYNMLYEKAVVRAILSFSTNLLIVVALIFFHDERMLGVSIAFVLGSLISAVLPIISSIKNGLRLSFKFNLKSQYFSEFINLFIPIVLVALLTDSAHFVDKLLASSTLNGVSYLNYGNKPVAIFDSVFIVGLGVILIPLLSKYNLEGNNKKLINVITSVIKYMIIILLPIVVICLVLNKEIITILYNRGAFDYESVIGVSKIFMAYSPLILLNPLFAVYSKIFHSIENTKLPLFINIVVILLNIMVSCFLFNFFGIVGLAFGTTISMLFGCLLFEYFINKKIGWNSIKFNFIDLLKILLVNLVSLIFIYLVKFYVKNSFLIVIYATLITFVFNFFYYCVTDKVIRIYLINLYMKLKK